MNEYTVIDRDFRLWSKAQFHNQQLRKKHQREALKDERQRFNNALDTGKVVFLHAHGRKLRVVAVDRDFWYHSSDGSLTAGFNDSVWAGLLKQACVVRNSFFRK